MPVTAVNILNFKGCVGWVVSGMTNITVYTCSSIATACPKKLQALGSRNKNLIGFEVGIQ
jgi:hypothetical protein